MQIVPALNIHNGKASTYIAGKNDHVDYLDEDPYNLVKKIGNHKIQRVHIIDVDAYSADGKSNTALIGSLSNTCVVDLEVGGGIKDMAYLKSLQYAGVDFFVLGSVVYDNYDFLNEIAQAEHIKNDKILISIDVKDGQLFYHGWTDPVEGITPKELIWKCMNTGFTRFIVTDVDSQRKEPDFNFYKELVELYSGAKIGAAGSIKDFETIDKLAEIGVDEVIIGNRIYKDDALLDKISTYNEKYKSK